MAASDQITAAEAARAGSPARAVPERSRGAEGLRVGGDFVVLDSRGERLRGLNATGAAVWELVDGRRALGEIAAEIARRHAAPEERVLQDVLAFARALAATGLIRFQEAAP